MKIKRFIVHQLIQRPFETLFGTEIERKWKQVSELCYSYSEALYLRDLLEKSDKFTNKINNYKIVCIEV